MVGTAEKKTIKTDGKVPPDLSFATLGVMLRKTLLLAQSSHFVIFASIFSANVKFNGKKDTLKEVI